MQESQEMWVQPLSQEDPLEQEMETHSSILVWKNPLTEKLGRLQSLGLQRVGHSWATDRARAYTHTHTHTHTVNQLFHNQLIGLFVHSTCIYWTSTICQSGKYLWTWTIQIPALVEVTLWWRNINNKEVGKYVSKIISHGTLQRKLKKKIGTWSERAGGSRWI